MTDTARDEHSQKNGALGNAGNHRGIPPSGIASHVIASHVTGAQPVAAVAQPVAASAAAVETTRSPSSIPPASATFGRTELHSTGELHPLSELPSATDLESGVHQTVNGALRATSEAPPTHDLVLLSVTETQVAPGWASADEELSHYELTVIVRGTQNTVRDDGEANSGPVEALLLKPGQRRQERNKGEVDLHRLRIGFHWRTASPEVPETVQDTCGRLHEIASWLVAERDAQFPNVSDYRQGLLRALVGEYLRLSVVAASRIEEKTRTYMLRHLGEPITLEDLATNIGMSRYYFCRVYKEVAGHTPMEHLRALRLERAKDLIRSTALPLKAIAPEVGFGSAQHLCRLLHDRFGVGVRELRGAGTLESRGVVTERGRDTDDAS
jgi:AraC-like DNA-binding protein